MYIKYLQSFVKQFLFWLLFFALGRTIFLIYNISNLSGIPFLEIIRVYGYALKLDMSTACYLMLFPFLIILFHSVFQFRFLIILNLIYSFLFIFIVAVITSAELGIYEEWRVKLNYKAITYLSQPSEVIRSARTFILVFGTILIILQTGLGIYIYKKYIYIKQLKGKRNFLFSVLFMIIVPLLLLIGIRGGWQQIPITQSDAYFSKYDILNQSAVNTEWNLFQSILGNKKYLTDNPYDYYSLKDAVSVVDSLRRVKKDTTIFILKNKRPNIVLIILESWSGDNISALSDLKGITPQFEKLSGEGLLFTRCYATGNLSDQGIMGVFSGYPSLPWVYISTQPDKFQKLPCMIQKLKQSGYYTSFYFGGELNYGNIKGYMISNHFDQIVEGVDFKGEFIKGKLGIHDGYALDYWLREINQFKAPFFTSLFTISSHSPFDEPMQKVLHWGGDHNNYINSVYYTDSCLGNFFKQARKQKWFENTLFILVADHSHDSPKQWNFFEPNYKKIPLLFYGDVIKNEYKGKTYDKICSQVDLTTTLLKQLNFDTHEFQWSNNLFNPYRNEYAYYAFHQGIGWVTPEGYFAIQEKNNFFGKQIPDSSVENKILREGRAYIQVFFNDYLSY